MEEKFLTLEDVSVQVGGSLLLDKLNFSIHRGQQWALTGPSGSGKTVFIHTLAGRHFYNGLIEFNFGPGPGKGEAGDAGAHFCKIAIVEQQHRFKNLSNTADLYYQQRFNSFDSDQTMTVEQELNEYAFAGNPAEEKWLEILHVKQLLYKPLIQLSNGENKRVQLAIALLEDPELLILDNPFLGLDIEGRRILHRIINELAQKGIQLLLITTEGEIPEAITHVARLEKGKLVSAGRKQDYTTAQAEHRHTAEAGKLDPGILARLRRPADEDFSVAVKMVNTTVRYGDATILDGINWEVKKGEKWNVSGPNGAGKSTILSLITADNPQAYANEIWLFDRRRGSGESIWDIKKKIGYVSPELHLYFDFSASCFEVIASGLFDTIGLFRGLSGEQEESILIWMQFLGLSELRTKRLSQLSTGQQRMVLLARALIKNPPVLILDEPCQGLDDEQTGYFKNLINLLCEAFNTTLIYVSHYQQEIPDCVDRFLQLKNGTASSLNTGRLPVSAGRGTL